jgi:hypothetical protein
MTSTTKLGLTAALLASVAWAAPVSAQDSTPTQPRVQQEMQKAPSASQVAPGKQKIDGQPATEAAPGQQQKSGAADSAAQVAPGQVKPMQQDDAASDATAPKTDGQADAAKPDAPKASGNAATDAAPGQQQKDGQADAKDAAPGQIQKDGQADAKDAAPGQQDKNQAAGETAPSNETTASIDISTEQKTEIKTIIEETRVEPARVDIDINVGVAVPTTVEFYPLPPRIVEIVPQYRGYEYFILADGRIIIVEPASHEVVYIIVA